MCSGQLQLVSDTEGRRGEGRGWRDSVRGRGGDGRRVRERREGGRERGDGGGVRERREGGREGMEGE